MIFWTPGPLDGPLVVPPWCDHDNLTPAECPVCDGAPHPTVGDIINVAAECPVAHCNQGHDMRYDDGHSTPCRDCHGLGYVVSDDYRVVIATRNVLPHAFSDDERGGTALTLVGQVTWRSLGLPAPNSAIPASWGERVTP